MRRDEKRREEKRRDAKRREEKRREELFFGYSIVCVYVTLLNLVTVNAPYLD